MFELTHSWFAVLTLLIAVLYLAQRRSLADLTPLQRRSCFAIRTLIVLFLVLALTGVRWMFPSRSLSVIFAVDDSASVSPAARQQARDFIGASGQFRRSNDTVAVVGFAERAEVWQPPLERIPAANTWPAVEHRTGTDLAGAMEFASALFPAAKSRRLVLLSDGNDTSDRAFEAAQNLRAAGIELFTVPLQNGGDPEVLVEKLEVPSRLKAGESFDLVAQLRSTVATSARVKLYQNQFLVEERTIELRPGANDFRAANLKADGNFISFELEVSSPVDTAPENNRAQVTASLRGRARALLVEGEQGRSEALADVLRGEKIDVETRGLLGAPKTLEDLQQFDLALFSDVPALALTREQMELYRRWVQEFGGGFVMIGGEQSFGVGGYFRTPVEQMLPVRMEHQDRQDVPSVALLIVLDRSGSMTALVQGVTKMSLANQGAALALNVLQAKDLFGVLAVDTRAHVVAPLQQHASRSAIEQKILSITAGGGGIYVYTSLGESFQLLRDVPARIKHVILFSDSADAEEKVGGEMGDGVRGGGSALDLASAMLAAKITTSVVALGLETDKDTAFLRQLAERGNGRFYLTSDATSLPQIFTSETMKVAQSSMVEEPFLAVPRSKHAAIAGIDWAQSPLLLGYNTTKLKPTAELLLATERNEPLLALWRYGLGHAAAFTSDAKSRWAAEWLGWAGFGKFWTQVVRAVMRKSEQASFAIQSRENGNELEIEIDAVKPDGSFHNELPIIVSASGSDNATRTVEARQTAPGRYRAVLAVAPEGTTMIAVSSPELAGGGAVFGHTRSYPREFARTETDENFLRQLAQIGRGRFAAKADEVFAPPAKARGQPRLLTDYFLIAALLLFPVDIWLRRRTWR